MVVLLVHLALNRHTRELQLYYLTRLLQDRAEPVVLAGDFNVLWGDRELQLFLAAAQLNNANRNGEPSHPSRAPRRELDFIFHSPEIHVTHFQIPPVKFSDHTPLICDFEVETAT